MAKPFLEVLSGERRDPPPIGLCAKQVVTRRSIGNRERGLEDFDLCYTPEFAVEVTLQPIERYGFDAAILFSDILVVPDGLDRMCLSSKVLGPC